MSLRFTKLPVLAFCLAVLAAAQDAPQTPAPGQTAPPAAAPAPPATKQPGVPDYPDPRTLTVGIWYWVTVPGSGPDVRGGLAAAAFSTLDNLGGDHRTPGVEVSMPITRTGVLHFEAFLSKGDGTQTASQDTNPFSTSFNKGDFLASQYQITAGKLYLDDLLHPFKFPVARFRLKSLWEVQYIVIKSTIDAPFKTVSQDSSGNVPSTTATGSKAIIFPTFGIAAEYDLVRHVTFRAGGSGFGLPHRALIWDAEATISYRRGNLEIVGGGKALHFKTSPQRDEYLTDTLDGGFIGLRWHL